MATEPGGSLMGFFDIFKSKPSKQEASDRSLESADASQFPGGDQMGMYAGGSGISQSDPVVIKATDTVNGILAEYAWVQRKFGKKNSDWKLVLQSHGPVGNRHLEQFDIKTSDGLNHSIYFDITSFHGKF
jgi:hypothetical protein